jgi:hypothetical protein
MVARKRARPGGAPSAHGAERFAQRATASRAHLLERRLHDQLRLALVAACDRDRQEDVPQVAERARRRRRRLGSNGRRCRGLGRIVCRRRRAARGAAADRGAHGAGIADLRQLGGEGDGVDGARRGSCSRARVGGGCAAAARVLLSLQRALEAAHVLGELLLLMTRRSRCGWRSDRLGGS